MASLCWPELVLDQVMADYYLDVASIDDVARLHTLASVNTAWRHAVHRRF
jgi:hypothetical protein